MVFHQSNRKASRTLALPCQFLLLFPELYIQFPDLCLLHESVGTIEYHTLKTQPTEGQWRLLLWANLE